MADHVLMKVVKYLTIILGLWPVKLMGFPLKLYNLYFILSFSYFILFDLTQLIQAFLIFGRDWNETASNLGVTIVYIIIIYKMVIMKSAPIVSLIYGIEKREKRILASKDENVINIYMKFVKAAHRSAIFYVLYGTCGISLYFASPFLTRPEEPSTNDTIKEHAFIFSSWFPFDANKHYGIAYTIQLLGIGEIEDSKTVLVQTSINLKKNRSSKMYPCTNLTELFPRYILRLPTRVYMNPAIRDGISRLITSYTNEKIANHPGTCAGGFYGYAYIGYGGAFLFNMLIYCIAQLQILQHVLRNFTKYAKIYQRDNNITYENAQRALIRLVMREHNYIITFVETLDNALSLFMLLDFITSSFQMSLLVFQFLDESISVLQQIMIFSYFTTLTIQLFVTYWNAHGIIIESSNIAQAAFESDWITYTEDVKKYYILIIARAQKPLSLTIGPIYQMKVDALLSIFKAIYSYVALIQRTK